MNIVRTAHITAYLWRTAAEISWTHGRVVWEVQGCYHLVSSASMQHILNKKSLHTCACTIVHPASSSVRPNWTFFSSTQHAYFHRPTFIHRLQTHADTDIRPHNANIHTYERGKCLGRNVLDPTQPLTYLLVLSLPAKEAKPIKSWSCGVRLAHIYSASTPSWNQSIRSIFQYRTRTQSTWAS